MDLMKRMQGRKARRCHDATFPFPFSFFELPAALALSVMIVSLSAEAVAASSIPGVTASQIRIVLSSEQDANIRSFFGFQATVFTLPSPWPDRTSSNAPDSRCHTYTFPSTRIVRETFYIEREPRDEPSEPLATKFPSTPPKQLLITCLPCFCPVNLQAIRDRVRSHKCISYEHFSRISRNTE